MGKAIVMNLSNECNWLQQDVFNETRSILEPAGAVALAGAKAFLKHYGLKVGRYQRLDSYLSGLNHCETPRLASFGPQERREPLPTAPARAGPPATLPDPCSFGDAFASIHVLYCVQLPVLPRPQCAEWARARPDPR